MSDKISARKPDTAPLKASVAHRIIGTEYPKAFAENGDSPTALTTSPGLGSEQEIPNSRNHEQGQINDPMLAEKSLSEERDLV